MKRSILFFLILCIAGCMFIILANPANPKSSSNSTKGKSSSVAMRIFDSLARINRIRNNKLSIHYAKEVLKIARNSESKKDLVNAYQLLGIAYNYNYKDSSYKYYNLALKLTDSSNFLKQRISILCDLSELYHKGFDDSTAIRMLEKTIILAQSINDFSGLSTAYNLLGNIKFESRDFADAERMYDTSFQIAKKYLLYNRMGVSLANIAKYEKDTIKRISRNKEALEYLKKDPGSELEMGSVLINIGNRYDFNPDSAIHYFNLAIKMASASPNLSEILMAGYNGLAYAYIQKKDMKKAESCLKDYAIPIAKKDTNLDWLASLYDSYADIKNEQGNFKEAFDMLKNSIKTRKQANELQASDQVRLLAALLDLKSKEFTIQTEQKELLIQKNRLQKTELWLLITSFLVVGIILISLWIQQRNRARLHLEQITSAGRIIQIEENEKGVIARELHDITGQLVMGITGEIENLDLPDQLSKEYIKEKINELGQNIRRISHRMNSAMIRHFTFSELIAGLCKDIQRFSGLKISLEMPDQIQDLNEEISLHAYRIIQELLNNANKYAHESQIQLKITDNKNKIFLHYSDNGPGFEIGEKKKFGMGLMNIFERTKLIGGKAHIDSRPGRGTTWNIIIPMIQKHKEITKK